MIDEIGGYRRLWLAVIQQAAEDAHSKNAEDKPIQAREWFKSDSVSPGSFRWICEVFDIDHVVVTAAVFSGYGMKGKKRAEA